MQSLSLIRDAKEASGGTVTHDEIQKRLSAKPLQLENAKVVRSIGVNTRMVCSRSAYIVV